MASVPTKAGDVRLERVPGTFQLIVPRPVTDLTWQQAWLLRNALTEALGRRPGRNCKNG